MTSKHRQAIQRGQLLEFITITWNVIEASATVTLGVLANSALLLGFGLDAVVEASSGLILLWRLRHGDQGEARERMAQRLVGLSLLGLAAFVAFDSIKALLNREIPDASFFGMVIAGISIIIMPLLARLKRQVAVEINSQAMKSDSMQTQICAYLSGIVLIGVSMNMALGWWWADPVAALCIVPIIVQEGIESLRGQDCGCHDHLCREERAEVPAKQEAESSLVVSETIS